MVKVVLKRLFGLFVMTGFLLFVCSCTEEVPKVLDNTTFSVEPAYLSLSSSSLEFHTYNSSSQYITVTSTNVDWEFTDIPNWITVSPMSGTATSGKVVTITCSKNDFAKDRTGVFIFRSKDNEWNYLTSVTVSQARNVYQAIPDRDSIEFTWVESQAIIKVNANNDLWTVTAHKDLESWCTVRKNNDVAEVYCSQNSSANPRSGYLTIATVDGEHDVKIYQSGFEMAVNVENSDSALLHFSDKAGTASITVNTLPKVQWTASTPDDWITLTPSNGTGSGVISVSVANNEQGPSRTGVVRIQAYDYVHEIAVIQNGLYLNVDCPLLSFGSRGGDVILSVKTNDGWSAQTDCDWMSLSETEGDGDCNILLTVAENNTFVDRSGSITITPKVITPMKLSVKQFARYLELSDSSEILLGSGGLPQKTITVHTDCQYDVTVDCEYIEVVKGDGFFTLKLKDIDTTEEISATVTVFLIGLPDGMELIRKIPIIIRGLVAVDLGLSVKWASCNVGALHSEEVGDYFAWGEVTPYYENGYAQSDNPVWNDGTYGYSWSSYTYAYGSETNLNKYCSQGEYGIDGYTDNKTILDLEDDAAYVNWGERWRIPTQDEFEELLNNCTWTWSIQNGIKGYRVTGNKAGYTNNSIFLPLTGIRRYNVLDQKDMGYYWSASLNSGETFRAAYIQFYSSNTRWIENESRCFGMAIRPVYQYPYESIDSITINCRNRRLLINHTVKLTVEGCVSDGNKIKLRDVIWTSDDESVATVLDGMVKAVGKGTCTITARLGSHTNSCFITVIGQEDIVPEYVDLGLSVNWATFNLGAYEPDMFGDYYAWGETEPHYESGYAESDNPIWKNGKQGYEWSSYKYAYNGNETNLTKYCTNGGYGLDGFADNKTVLDPEDDAAHVNWGGKWRMPTKEEFDELRAHCQGEWITLNNVMGIKYTSKLPGYTDRSIFLPAAGDYWSTLNSQNNYGYYNTSSLNSETPTDAYEFILYQYNWYVSCGSRVAGHSVRAVCPMDESNISKLSLENTEYLLFINEQTNIYVIVEKTDGNSISFTSAEWTSSDNSVATVINGTVKAVGVGTCIITASYGSHSDDCTVTVIDPDAVTHESVDLGLSVNWATFNIGAIEPEMFGDYYAWGETETYYELGYAYQSSPLWKNGKREGYIWSSYSFCNGSSTTLTKYCTDGSYGNNGFTDGKTVLEPEDDIAHIRWGGTWRMPTKEEAQELCDQCTWKKDTINGVAGYRVTSNVSGYTERSIFLPSAGYRYSTTYYGSQNGFSWGESNYWTSSLNADQPSCAWRLKVSGSPSVAANNGRHDGNAIRPVCPSE